VVVFWWLGFVVWGVVFGPQPQTPQTQTPNPQSPIPNPHFKIEFNHILFIK